MLCYVLHVTIMCRSQFLFCFYSLLFQNVALHIKHDRKIIYVKKQKQACGDILFQGKGAVTTRLRVQFTNLSIRTAVQCQSFLNKGMEVDVDIWQQLTEDHIIVQITAENRCRERKRRVQPQGLKNVLLNFLRRCRCQCQAGDAWHASTYLTQFEVVWPKIVAPLGDAVSLIHCKVGQQAAGAQACQAGLK